MPWAMPPSALPSTIASTDCQKLRPNAATARMPTKMVANSMFGDVQVQKSRSGRP
jgi:hypothetical protein